MWQIAPKAWKTINNVENYILAKITKTSRENVHVNQAGADAEKWKGGSSKPGAYAPGEFFDSI